MGEVLQRVGDRRELGMGEGMSEWKEVRLGDICDVYDGPHATPPKLESGLIFLGISSLGFDGRIDPTHFEYISEESFKKWTRRVEPRYQDIVFSYETKLGVAAIIPQSFKCCLGRRMGLLRPKDGVHPNFLLYAYLSPDFQKTIYERTFHGSTVDRIPLKDMPDFPIRFPPLPEQKAIASILSSLDDKIDLLHRQNKTLEAIAEALFRHWFIEEAQDDWEEISIVKLFEVRDGTHDSPKQTNIGKYLITSKHILDGQIDIDNAYLISEDDFNKVNQRSKVDTGDILFSMIGTIGLIYLEQSSEIDYAIKNIGLFKTSQNPDWAIYTYLWLKSPTGRQFIDEHKSGSTQEYVALGSLRSIVFQSPPLKALKEFNKFASEYFSKMTSNRAQIRTLEKLRDNLLPKLMSGDMRVEI